ncbi:hypothetical protein HAZT_HAZT004945 [Hyalella azteca]|uniref:HMG box-containing protein 1 n=1 Tax=Hyalella azteca TaxID=294128 RepID=A0A6A0GWZ7_HYAAZ|nr:hypothetical protein HAZT_HAZT004945 [Hyalella azteca]
MSKRTLVQCPENGLLQASFLPGRPSVPSPSPRSPFLQKNLPLRKRAHSWSSQPGALSYSSAFTLDSSIPTIKDEQLEPVDEDACCRCSNSSLRFAGLPTPHTPHTPHPHSAIPVLTSKFNFSEGNPVASAAASHHHYSSAPLNLSLGGGLPSSLLSPAPSHPSTSSLSSSREELEPDISDPSYAAPLDCSGTVSFVNINYFHCSSHPYCAQPREQERTSPSGRTDELKSYHLPYQTFHENDSNRSMASAMMVEPYFKHEYCSDMLTTPGPPSHHDEYAGEQMVDLTTAKNSPGCKSERLDRNVSSPGSGCTCSNCSAPGHLSPYAQTFPDDRDLGWHRIVWSVFLPDVRIHFAMGEEMSCMRLSQELGKLEKEHKELYACHGVILRKYSYVTPGPESQYFSEDSTVLQENHPEVKMTFSPVGLKQQDVLAVVPCHHPFFVQHRGWCSTEPALTLRVHGFMVSKLYCEDVCLPPYHKNHDKPCLMSHFNSGTDGTKPANHPPALTQLHLQAPAHPHSDVVHSTDHVADAMSRFDFNDDPLHDTSVITERGELLNTQQFLPTTPFTGASFVQYAPPSSHGLAVPQPYNPAIPHRSGLLSPPASPSKKSSHANGAAPSKPRRPMNGFMLFAKRHRLKLIQQHPGKDNRAISVLLGGTWKALPDYERERYNNEARLQAEQMKKIDPDCWKRKRSHSTC